LATRVLFIKKKQPKRWWKKGRRPEGYYRKNTGPCIARLRGEGLKIGRKGRRKKVLRKKGEEKTPKDSEYYISPEHRFSSIREEGHEQMDEDQENDENNPSQKIRT